MMNLREMVKANLKDEELMKALRENGWSYTDYCNMRAFMRANGELTKQDSRKVER